MQTQASRVQALIEPAVTAFGFELLGVQVLREGRNPTLRVYIDKQEGITVDDVSLAFEEIKKAGPGGHFVSSRLAVPLDQDPYESPRHVVDHEPHRRGDRNLEGYARGGIERIGAISFET